MLEHFRARLHAHQERIQRILLWLDFCRWLLFLCHVLPLQALRCIIPIVIVNISFREERFPVAENALNVNDWAKFADDSGSYDFVIIQCPNTFVELIAHVREFNRMTIAIPVNVFLVECIERFAGNQMLLNEFA